MITAIVSAYIPPEHMDRIRRKLTAEMRALVDILRLTGYRVDDLLKSREYQWYGKDGYVILYEHKTKKQRKVTYSEEIKEAVERYKAVRQRTRSVQPLRYFVQGLRDFQADRRHRHRSTVYRHFAEAVKRAGLEGHGYTIHSLRKCYAVDLYNATGSLLEVQRDLGHESLSTTCLYVFGSRASL